jgi:hypothetical protein
VGATAWLRPGFPRIGGNHRMGTRTGAEENRSSTLPAAIARPGDFAPTSTVFRCLLSRPSLAHPVWSDVGREGGRLRGARLQGSRAIGRCHAALPRRSATLTCPRHLPSQGRSRTNEGSFCCSASRAAVRPTPFSPPGARAGDARVHK